MFKIDYQAGKVLMLSVTIFINKNWQVQKLL